MTTRRIKPPLAVGQIWEGRGSGQTSRRRIVDVLNHGTLIQWEPVGTVVTSSQRTMTYSTFRYWCRYLIRGMK